MQIAAELFKEVAVKDIEEIRPFTTPPWTSPPRVVIQEADKAEKEARTRPRRTVDIYTRGSIRNDRAGIGVYTGTEVLLSRTIAAATHITTHLTELEAIQAAVTRAHQAVVFSLRPGQTVDEFRVRIFSQSKAALQAIQKPMLRDSQQIISNIIEHTQGQNITLHWVPSQAGIEQIEYVHELAEKATEEGSDEPPRRAKRPIRLAYSKAKAADYPSRAKPARANKASSFTRKIDTAISVKHTKHTKTLYNTLSREDAAVLAQLRTGKCSLNGYLFKIKRADTKRCGCGSVETIPHVLYNCRRWRAERAELKQAHGTRYGDLSFALGGYSSDIKDGKPVDGEVSKWKPDMQAVKATIKFAKDTGRFRNNTGFTGRTTAREEYGRSQCQGQGSSS